MVADRPTTTEDALDVLGRVLYEKMETLDPNSAVEMVPWDKLNERDRDFYRLCVSAVLAQTSPLFLTLIRG